MDKSQTPRMNESETPQTDNKSQAPLMNELTRRGVHRGTRRTQESSRKRLFAVAHSHENEDARVKADAERAIHRVFAEWGERENGRLPKIPTSVEELVRFHCLDYERRARALAERDREREKESAFTPCKQGANEVTSDNNSLHTESASHRCRHAGGAHAQGAPRLRVARKRTGRRTLAAPTATHYRRLNMLIDLAFSLACEEGVRATMRADVAARRGDRRTNLYYVDRRAYLRQKRQAKLALAAVLGLL